MCNNEASRAAIETFYQKEDVQRLVVTMNPDLTAVRARGEATRGARSPPASPLDAIAKLRRSERRRPRASRGGGRRPTDPRVVGPERPPSRALRARSPRSLTPRRPALGTDPSSLLLASPQSLAPPEESKKTLCFLKLNETELNPENVDQEVIYGDFGNVPLEHLSVLAETVFLPMLTNPKNQVGWPEVIEGGGGESHKFSPTSR